MARNIWTRRGGPSLFLRCLFLFCLFALFRGRDRPGVCRVVGLPWPTKRVLTEVVSCTVSVCLGPHFSLLLVGYLRSCSYSTPTTRHDCLSFQRSSIPSASQHPASSIVPALVFCHSTLQHYDPYSSIIHTSNPLRLPPHSTTTIKNRPRQEQRATPALLVVSGYKRRRASQASAVGAAARCSAALGNVEPRGSPCNSGEN
jgi:hypothetical protein